MRRLASGLLLTGALALAGAVSAAPASAAACSGSTGVTVIVDTGSSISTTCAAGDPSSAKAALQAGGHSTTDVQTQPGFLCRIDGAPAADPCVRTPPSSAYWAFWTAQRGGGWSYAQVGYAQFNPAPGTVIGFRFGSGQQPRVAPPAATVVSTPKPTTTTARPKTTAQPRPKPTVRTTAPPRVTAAPATTAAPGAAVPPAGSGSSPAPTSGVTSTGPTTSSAAAPTDSTPAASASGSETAVAAPAAPSAPSGGGGLPTLLTGAGVLAALGAAGVVVHRRRALA